MHIVSLGEVLWDVFEHGELLGGAPLNFAANMQRLGHRSTLLTAVGADPRGALVFERMRALGLSTEFVQTTSERATGSAIITTDSAGNAGFVIERPAAFDCLLTNDALWNKIQNSHPDWIYYGTLAQTNQATEKILIELTQSCKTARHFYDVNLRTGHWNLQLVERLSEVADILKLNETEAELLFQLTGKKKEFSLEAFCEDWSSAYGRKILCITLGDKGCAIYQDNKLQRFSGYQVEIVDTVGAGDAFAAAFLHGLDAGWRIEKVAGFANALGALVASRAGATPAWTVEEALKLQ